MVNTTLHTAVPVKVHVTVIDVNATLFTQPAVDYSVCHGDCSEARLYYECSRFFVHLDTVVCKSKRVPAFQTLNRFVNAVIVVRHKTQLALVPALRTLNIQL